MTMDANFFEINDNDFVVRIRPTVVDSEWTGEIDVAIMTSGDCDLDDESYSQMMHFTKMMCATVPLMELNSQMRELAHAFVMEHVDTDPSPVIEEESQLVVTKEDGNVVHLNFGTRTKGSA
jgi:hypothetical protein